MMKRALAFLLLLAQAAFPAHAADPGADANDVARFLAGLPVSPGSPLNPLMQDPAWRQHADYFASAWARLEVRQLSKARAWAEANLRGSGPNVFYMFSGPDFLYAHALFPGASNYVLCGIEPVGTMPDPAKLALGPALYRVESALNSVLNYSFFQTRQMREDLGASQVNGTLPVLLVFLARDGKAIQHISPVPHGVRIDFDGGTLYYFCVDLSNGTVEKSGLLAFCKRLGRGSSLLKSASYLPHGGDFSAIRNFLLDQSDLIVEDDSGIPYRDLDPAQWQVRFYGRYQPPIDCFKQFNQPDLADAFARSSPQDLPFGIGYRGWDPAKSALIVARRK